MGYESSTGAPNPKWFVMTNGLEISGSNRIGFGLYVVHLSEREPEQATIYVSFQANSKGSSIKY